MVVSGVLNTRLEEIRNAVSRADRTDTQLNTAQAINSALHRAPQGGSLVAMEEAHWAVLCCNVYSRTPDASPVKPIAQPTINFRV